ncbi:glycoside hydrolase family 3 C-terminal domain-containing protein, partial [Coprobacter fastidiosus]
ETFGEDPYLTSRLGVNLVKGMQGNDLRDNNTVASEPKHFGIHGIPESGTNASSVNIGEREARSFHLYTFEKAVKEGHAQGVMAAYHDIDGIPCVANEWLLSKILREEWGFDGIVVSDLGAIRRQVNDHHTAVDTEDAVVKSLQAGLNMQFYDFPYDDFQKAVVEAVKNGTLDEAVLDSRVADVLRLKFRLGLFENPYTEDSLAIQAENNAEHKALALKAAQESLILLKNENNTLPFKQDVKRITLVGELANQSLLGGYSPAQARGITVYEALKDKFGKNIHIDFIESQIEDSFKSIPNSVLYTEAGGENGVYVEFFNGIDLKGTPAYKSVDPEISHYWHNLSPVPGVNRDMFSARWKGVIKAPVTGEYEFKMSADNWSKLYLGGKLVIDQWDNGKNNGTYRIRLHAGQILPIQVEYAEIDDNAWTSIEWRLVGRTMSADALYNRVIASARTSDITIVVVGESMNLVGEGKDRQNLNMNERDVKLLQAVRASGCPAATVLMHGRPFVMTPADEYSDAILDAWYPGEFGGKAIVEALFGDINPSGKLTVSVPRSQGQLPVTYLKKRSFKHWYVDGNTIPLYAFGHGLSYTTFKYGDMQLSAKEINKDENLTVSFTVENTGKMRGTEICQLYLTDKVSSVSLPGKALKGFSRVELAPGEKKTVEIILTPEHFSLINADMQRVVEPGLFEISVGPSSATIELKGEVTVK